MEFYENKIEQERAVLVSVDTGEFDVDSSLRELTELARTAGAEVICEMTQKREAPEAGTYLGKGKLQELSDFCEAEKPDLIIIDGELSPAQQKNIETITDVRVIDRTTLILDIFAGRALSGEGKLQVELAQLKYALPRLGGKGASISRLCGGIGTRGPCETKLETDRRHIRRRISALSEDLKELDERRTRYRERRKKDGVLTVALVGYTNAGKSTLMNTLTDAGVLAENKLFATLDPTSRAITLPDNRKILLVDTVGFISKLPHHLVDAFKSTLEEAVVADVLLHVIDSSSDAMTDQIEVTKNVLSSIGATGKPVIGVYNKADLCNDYAGFCHFDHNVIISAKNKTGIDELINAIADVAPGKKQEYTMIIPYTDGSVLSAIHQNQKVLSEEYTESGTKIIVLLDSENKSKYEKYIV